MNVYTYRCWHDPPRNNHHQNYYMFGRGSLSIFTFHCWRGITLMHIYTGKKKYMYICMYIYMICIENAYSIYSADVHHHFAEAMYCFQFHPSESWKVTARFFGGNNVNHLPVPGYFTEYDSRVQIAQRLEKTSWQYNN